METIVSQLITVINEEIRPWVERDGGSIEYRDFQDGIVYIVLGGVCKTCPAIDLTLKIGIERSLRKSFREVRSVQLWTGG